MPRGSAMYWENLTSYTVVSREVHGQTVHVITETPRRGSCHACSPDDIFRILTHVPARDVESLQIFVQRQPKRKEEILAGVWGRIVFWAELGRPQDSGVFRGTAIFLDAAPEGEGF